MSEKKEEELLPEIRDKGIDSKKESNFKDKRSGKILLPSIKTMESVGEGEAVFPLSAEEPLQPPSPSNGEELPQQPPTGEEMPQPSVGEEINQPLPDGDLPQPLPSGEPETPPLPRETEE